MPGSVHIPYLHHSRRRVLRYTRYLMSVKKPSFESHCHINLSEGDIQKFGIYLQDFNTGEIFYRIKNAFDRAALSRERIQ